MEYVRVHKQCVRVCGEASEMFGGTQSLAYEVVSDREQDSLIDQLKDQTAALMQELKGSTTEVHQFYDDFSLHMNDSIKSVQAFKDMSLHICNNATTASSQREEIKKSQDALRWRECWTQNRKGKGPAHNAW